MTNLGADDLRADDLAERREQALELVRAAYRHDRVESPPMVIGDVNYWISGEDPGRVPADYFEPGAYASQQAFQEAKIRDTPHGLRRCLRALPAPLVRHGRGALGPGLSDRVPAR